MEVSGIVDPTSAPAGGGVVGDSRHIRPAPERWQLAADTRQLPQATGRQPAAGTGSWQLTAGNWQLATDSWKLAAGNWRPLYEAIAEGRIGGAALNVFEREPYVPVDEADDLRTLDRVLLVPHLGSNTAHANRRMAERALRNVRLGEAGDLAQLDLLHPEVLSAEPRS